MEQEPDADGWRLEASEPIYSERVLTSSISEMARRAGLRSAEAGVAGAPVLTVIPDNVGAGLAAPIRRRSSPRQAETSP
jgi:hypothetical protein